VSNLFAIIKEQKMSKEQFKYPLRDIDDYIKEYIGNFNAFEYNENKDIETIKKEHNGKKVYVFDAFTTNQEQEAIKSAIYFLGDKIDNTIGDEWVDEEEDEHKETMKHLCRLYGRYSDRNRRVVK
tara:strand:- start:399 stop:773 length:375 start_codon:yes stop_codon:yes gene_type:complete